MMDEEGTPVTTPTTSSSSRLPNEEVMFSQRIVQADFYSAIPHPEFDGFGISNNSSYQPRVPVLRIYGSTPKGQKTCAHIHGVFPYLTILYDVNVTNFEGELATGLDRALNELLKKSGNAPGTNNWNNRREFQRKNVFRTTRIVGKTFYGFRDADELFLRVYFYSPLVVKKAADLLIGGAVLGTQYQPYDAHIPYHLQFLIDFNLYGMNLIHYRDVKFRPPSSGAQQQNQLSSASPAPTIELSSGSSTSSSGASTVWHLSQLPENSFSKSLEGMARCELEIDVKSTDIIVVAKRENARSANPGIDAIWKDEVERRRQKYCEESQVSIPDSQAREYDGEEFSAEALYQQMLKEKLSSVSITEDMEVSTQGENQFFENSFEASKTMHFLLPSLSSTAVAVTKAKTRQNLRGQMQSVQQEESEEEDELYELFKDFLEEKEKEELGCNMEPFLANSNTVEAPNDYCDGDAFKDDETDWLDEVNDIDWDKSFFSQTEVEGEDGGDSASEILSRQATAENNSSLSKKADASKCDSNICQGDGQGDMDDMDYDIANQTSSSQRSNTSNTSKSSRRSGRTRVLPQKYKEFNVEPPTTPDPCTSSTSDPDQGLQSTSVVGGRFSMKNRRKLFRSRRPTATEVAPSAITDGSSTIDIQSATEIAPASVSTDPTPDSSMNLTLTASSSASAKPISRIGKRTNNNPKLSQLKLKQYVPGTMLSKTSEEYQEIVSNRPVVLLKRLKMENESIPGKKRGRKKRLPIPSLRIGKGKTSRSSKTITTAPPSTHTLETIPEATSSVNGSKSVVKESNYENCEEMPILFYYGIDASSGVRDKLEMAMFKKDVLVPDVQAHPHTPLNCDKNTAVDDDEIEVIVIPDDDDDDELNENEMETIQTEGQGNEHDQRFDFSSLNCDTVGDGNRVGDDDEIEILEAPEVEVIENDPNALLSSDKTVDITTSLTTTPCIEQVMAKEKNTTHPDELFERLLERLTPTQRDGFLNQFTQTEEFMDTSEPSAPPRQRASSVSVGSQTENQSCCSCSCSCPQAPITSGPANDKVRVVATGVPIAPVTGSCGSALPTVPNAAFESTGLVVEKRTPSTTPTKNLQKTLKSPSIANTKSCPLERAALVCSPIFCQNEDQMDVDHEDAIVGDADPSAEKSSILHEKTCPSTPAKSQQQKRHLSGSPSRRPSPSIIPKTPTPPSPTKQYKTLFKKLLKRHNPPLPSAKTTPTSTTSPLTFFERKKSVSRFRTKNRRLHVKARKLQANIGAPDIFCHEYEPLKPAPSYKQVFRQASHKSRSKKTIRVEKIKNTKISEDRSDLSSPEASPLPQEVRRMNLGGSSDEDSDGDNSPDIHRCYSVAGSRTNSQALSLSGDEDELTPRSILRKRPLKVRLSKSLKKRKIKWDRDQDKRQGTNPKLETVDGSTSKSQSQGEENKSSGDTFINNSELDGPSPKNRFGFEHDLSDLRGASASHLCQHLTIMSIELHCDSRENLMPNPVMDRILGIFVYISNDYPNGSSRQRTFYKHLILNENLKHFKQSSAAAKIPDCFSDELEMIESFLSLFYSWDPDILVGYEIEKASWGYLIQRGAALGVDIVSRLSRILESKQWIPRDRLHLHTSEWNGLVEGRIVLNLWRLLRHEITVQSYTYENAAYHVLHRRVHKFNFLTLTGFWKRPSDRWRVINYYSERVKGSIELMENLDMVNRTSELARLFGILFYEVFSRGSQFRVESMMLRITKSQNLIPVSPSISQRAKMRAPEFLPLILEPMSTYYTDPVAVLDFQSLYPSMIIAYNYDYSTVIGRVEHLGRNERFDLGCLTNDVASHVLAKHLNEIHISPAGVAFMKKSVRKGVLPEMLEQILDTRLMVKRAMKKWKNEGGTLQKVLDSRQLGLKLIANVTYGYTSANFSGRMPCVEIADSVVSKGRETLQRAIELVKSRYEEWGGEVVYGDTDSLFVLFRGKSRPEAFKLGQAIAEEVTRLNPKPVKLKFEKIYQPCILQTKKRYVGYSYETEDQVEPKYDAKGIETVRRDGCPAIQKILEKSLHILFTTNDREQVKSFVQSQFKKIFSGRVSLKDYMFAREYRGRQGYKPGACVPSLEIAKKATSVDPRAEPLTKQRVPYVIVYDKPLLPLIKLVRTPLEFANNSSLRLNAHYYIEKAIIPALTRCLNFANINVSEWYKTLPRKYLRSVVNENRRGGQGTMDDYIKHYNCLRCGKGNSNGVCNVCDNDPQGTVSFLVQSSRDMHSKLETASQICVLCSGEDDKCESVDCPVFHKLLRYERDQVYNKQLLNKLKSLDF